jgi:hypothetical protein
MRKGCTFASLFGSDGRNVRVTVRKPFRIETLGVIRLRGTRGKELHFETLSKALAVDLLHVHWDADAGDISPVFCCA